MAAADVTDDLVSSAGLRAGEDLKTPLRRRGLFRFPHVAPGLRAGRGLKLLSPRQGFLDAFA